ncbi:hypothetical protein [Flavobacterium undicola]|uniref:hypothetical protein n=1 Tax=Flavobacterium undicola TaxID=1932779 RepID=UPI0015E22FEB|nr:hypothetical protein [Flavobacterium undicola]MBA0884897.1 hypothetical protein [Flavobacterium undicola]
MNPKEYCFSSFLYLFLLLWMFPAYAQNNVTVTDQLADQLQSVSKNNTSDLVYLQSY